VAVLLVIVFILTFVFIVTFLLVFVVTFLLVTVFVLTFVFVVTFFLVFVVTFLLVILVARLTVVLTVTVAALDEVDRFTGGDNVDISVVVTETCDQVISPWLESFRAVDEQIRIKNLPLDIRAGLPAVAMLADRNQCLCSRNVASDRIGERAKDEKRRLC